MAKKKPKKKKRYVWHSYYDAAHVLATAVAVVLSLGDVLSGAGIIMIACIAGSSFVLTYKYRHYLTTLGTITSAYLIGSALSVLLVFLLKMWNFSVTAQMLAVLVAVSALLLALNIFHPPAVAFGIAFIIFTKGTSNYFFVLFAALLVFIAIRLIIYIRHTHLDINKFFQEFLREEEHLFHEEEKRIIGAARRI